MSEVSQSIADSTGDSLSQAPVVETYPQQIEVSVVFKVLVDDREQKSYFLDPVTKTAAPPFITDLYDILDTVVCDIVTINDLTLEQVSKNLSEGSDY